MYNIHIEDSYKVGKASFKSVLATYKDSDALQVKLHRSERSLCREWAVHNFLHSLGLWKDRTKSVDLNYPQKWYVSLAYFLMGWCKLFIK